MSGRCHRYESDKADDSEIAHRATPGFRGLTTSLPPVYPIGSPRRVLAVRSTFDPNLAGRTALLLTCSTVACSPRDERRPKGAVYLIRSSHNRRSIVCCQL